MKVFGLIDHTSLLYSLELCQQHIMASMSDMIKAKGLS